MKHLKMLGLAVMASAALMAVAGTGSASAATLCHEKVEPCPAGKMYGPAAGDINEGHAVLKTGTEAVLKAGFATIKCKESTATIEGKTTGVDTGGTTWNETPGGPVTALTFPNESCNCIVTVLKNGELKIHTIAGTNNGTVTGAGAEVTINCGGVACIFGSKSVAEGGTDLGTLTAGGAPVLDVNTKVSYKMGDASSSVCTLGTGTATWTAEYTPTTSVFVTEH